MPFEKETSPLATVVSGWLGVLSKCKQVKKENFQNDADEAMQFFSGPYNWMWSKRYSSRLGTNEEENRTPEPTFKMSVNKTAEVVQIFGPTLYHKNPNRKVTPSELISITQAVPPEVQQEPEFQQMMQMEQQVFPRLKFKRRIQAALMEKYLNYTPNELNLKDHIRQALDEALIKGMGLCWTEAWTDPLGKQTLIGSFYDTVDNLLIDPDAETLEDAYFIIRKRFDPIWFVADKFGIPEKELNANIESWTAQGSSAGVDAEQYKRETGRANDCMVYYEIYSKMGVGHLLQGVKTEVKDALDKLGKYVYLVVAPGTEYPLNLSPARMKEVKNDDEILALTDWPIPFWADGTWPFTPFFFHTEPRCIWPQSHMKYAMGELKFLNWAYSFIASKIGTTSRDFLAVPKSLSEEMKNEILYGKDLQLLEIEEISGRTIQEVVSFLQHPQFNGDIWTVIEAVERNFEKRIGLNETSYGIAQKQVRVAADAEIRQQATQIRPQDMANKVEDSCTALARKEAIAARFLLTGKDVEPFMGPVAAQLWDQYIANSDAVTVALELDYRVEAGQARKPNKEKEVQNMQSAVQTVLPVLIQTGNFQAANALLMDWARSIDMVDPERYMIQPPPPPGPDPKQALIEAQTQGVLQTTQAKLQADAMRMQMKMQHGQQKAAIDGQEAQQELVMAGQEHVQSMSQSADKSQVEVLQAILKGATDRQIAQEKAVTDQIIKLSQEKNDAKAEKARGKD